MYFDTPHCKQAYCKVFIHLLHLDALYQSVFLLLHVVWTDLY